MTEATLICEAINGVGFITLNRPKALNALSLEMIRGITQALVSWRDDASIKGVVVSSSSEKAFCAGGDIRFFHAAAHAGDPRLEDFFTEEYTLNHLIHRYPKPYIALMDGLVMGGGMGITQGASLRVVTERSKLAMPETAIGLFPDVGGGYFLSRCEGQIGEWLALTGYAMSGREAVYFDLADVQCYASSLPLLLNALKTETIYTDSDLQRLVEAMLLDDEATIEYPDEEAFVDSLIALDDQISKHFVYDSTSAIIASLEKGDAWAKEQAAILRKKSPLSLGITLEQLRRARRVSLEDDLRMERNLVRNCFHLQPVEKADTVEGIRALAVDKDHTPKWQHARIEDVSQAEVQSYFDAPWPAYAHPLKDL
jgi:enoyl-CoA hydratase/carnithine racemase